MIHEEDEKRGEKINCLSIPFSVYVWRGLFSIKEFLGLEHVLEGNPAPLFIFLFGYPIIVLIRFFKRIIAYKYTFYTDYIVFHSVFGFKKEINKNQIIRIFIKSYEEYLEIQWRKKKFSTTKRIVILKESLWKLGLPLDEICEELRNIYLK